MTKQHFENLADGLAAVRPDALTQPARHGQWTHDVNAVAAACAAGSPRFNRDKFVQACQTRKAIR